MIRSRVRTRDEQKTAIDDASPATIRLFGGERLFTTGSTSTAHCHGRAGREFSIFGR